MHCGCIVPISVWNDENAKALARRFGARVLLDKVNFYSELISAIKENCPPDALSEPDSINIQGIPNASKIARAGNEQYRTLLAPVNAYA
jgi:hypothetical protein